MRKVAVCAAVIAAATQLLLAAGAGARRPVPPPEPPPPPTGPPISPIGQDQFFHGLVNSSSANAVISMACFGPEPVGGRMGHPLAGQSTAVTQVPPISSGAIVPGFTGLANSIEATVFFNIGPGVPPVGGAHLALFKFYNDPAAIPTEVELPCSGSGVVVFDPVLGGESARPADVTVTFQGQP